MAKLIALAKGLQNVPFANNGLKLSEKILIDKIDLHPKFQTLFPIDDTLLDRIETNMKEKGFDESQPVHIWKTTDDDGKEKMYLIDGYTRVKAAKDAGLESIPFFKHTFDTYEDAYRYALHMQLDRRQLSDADFMANLRELMGSDYIQNYKGRKTQAIADELQVSRRTIDKAISVDETATPEQKERIANGDATINQIYQENHPKKESENIDDEEIENDNDIDTSADQSSEQDIDDAGNFTEKANTTIDSDDSDQEKENKAIKEVHNASKRNPSNDNYSSDSDVSNALGSSEGSPASLNFNHSDGIERPKKLRDDSDPTDILLREKNQQIESAQKEYFAFLKATTVWVAATIAFA